jgi:hypothetical protein
VCAAVWIGIGRDHPCHWGEAAGELPPIGLRPNGCPKAVASAWRRPTTLTGLAGPRDRASPRVVGSASDNRSSRRYAPGSHWFAPTLVPSTRAHYRTRDNGAAHACLFLFNSSLRQACRRFGRSACATAVGSHLLGPFSGQPSNSNKSDAPGASKVLAKKRIGTLAWAQDPAPGSTLMANRGDRARRRRAVYESQIPRHARGHSLPPLYCAEIQLGTRGGSLVSVGPLSSIPLIDRATAFVALHGGINS